MLLGVALGDALGGPFEGWVAVTEADFSAHERADRQLVHTDDTALTLVLAEHLARHQGRAVLNEAALGREFAQAWRSEPWRGYGSGAAAVFRLLNAGWPYEHAARAVFQGEGSYGNGAAMRVAPIALAGTSLHHTGSPGGAQRSRMPTSTGSSAQPARPQPSIWPCAATPASRCA